MALVPHLRGSQVRAGQALRDIIAETLEADPLPAAGPVQEQVGGDPVQPPLERPRRVAGQGAEHADENFLREVFRVVLVSGEPVGEPVHARGVRSHDLFPAGKFPLG